MSRLATTGLVILVLAAPTAGAQAVRRPAPASPPVAAPPSGLPASEADIWPYPAPDPHDWWTEKRPVVPEAADPLGHRRLPRGARLPVIDNGVDASTYRLWGLTPLQWQVLRGGEMVLEAWVRPSLSVRQEIIRVTVRDGGRVFVQGRAGEACCEAGIARRVGFDAELPRDQARTFQALRDSPVWRTPRQVHALDAPGAVQALCVNGTGYDLTLLTRERAVSLHRACDPAEVGQIADILEPLVRAALGHEPRFDVLFPHGADFSRERKAYQDLVAHGGVLQPDPHAAQGAGFAPMPQPDGG